ncbi:MAG: toxic anion resistance protein [Lachnospiraceae bacterium]|nr:toxic anion resistance protein [Lachnospiraceae bacterium]
MSAFSLELPTEEEIKQEVAELTLPTPKEEVAIRDTAQERARQIMDADLDTFEQRKEYTDVINAFGLEDLKACRSKNAILQKRVGAFEKNGGEAGEVARGLADLTIRMKDMDPSGIDFLKQGPMGKLFNPARRYFEKYKTVDGEISEIVKSLEKGKKTLVEDNVTLEIEESEMRQVTKKMQSNIEMGTRLDESLSAAVAEAKATGEDEEKIRFVEEEILFPLRQRIEDFQQVQAVDQQGIMAMELIRRNNRELIRSVERAENVTVTALRTAATVAGALYNQKIVLEKITALNDETNHMISATAHMLREQGTAIQKQATEASISPDTLKESFKETIEALDEISRYRQEALPRMKQTIDAFRDIAEEGERQIARLEKQPL